MTEEIKTIYALKKELEELYKENKKLKKLLEAMYEEIQIKKN